MKRKLQKFLATVFATLFCCATASAYDFEVGGIYYNKIGDDKSAVEVTSGDVYYSGSITIPSSVEYEGKSYPVTSIGEKAFSGCIGLTKVIIADGNEPLQLVYDKDYGVFRDCKVQELYLGRNITWTNKIYYPYNNGFGFDKALSKATISNSVTSIAMCVFSHCSGLTDIDIPNSMTSIGNGAFYDCNGLTSVNIPNSVTSIGYNAFSGCSGLTSITIPNSVTSIGYDAFENCTGLTSIDIPNSVTSIESNTFSGCSGLTSVIIPNSVTSIGQSAFSGCSGLTKVIIEDGSKSLQIDYGYDEGYEVFKDCKVQELYLGRNITLTNKPLYYYDNSFGFDEALTKATISNSVTNIEEKAFYGCSSLTTIDIPNSVTEIGNYAFSGCTGLTSIDIPNSVTSIGNGSFYGCSGLTSVTIPNSVTSIGFGALLFAPVLRKL